MKLDESVRVAIVVGLWTMVAFLLFMIVLIFIKDTISGTQIRMLIVAIVLTITAKYFMEEKK